MKGEETRGKGEETRDEGGRDKGGRGKCQREVELTLSLV